jgi:3-oxoacyl-(acyl-carrier-protein) synthase
MRRVVVTGLGMVTPLGCGVEPTWKNLLEGKSGAARITDFEVEDLACKIACQIPRGDGSNGTYNPDQWMEPKEQRKVDPFIVYAMAAATQALNDADWHPQTYDDQCASGVSSAPASAASGASTRPPSRSWSAGPGACRPSSSPAASSTWRAAMCRSPTG